MAGSIKSAQLQPIAVTSGKRSASFNTIPTIAEGGIRSFDVSPWFGLMAPGKTPADVIARINRDINEQLRTKDVADRFAAQGADVYVTTPSEFASVLAADITKWGDVVRSSGAKID